MGKTCPKLAQSQDVLVMPHSATGATCGGWIVARISGGPKADLICSVCGPTGAQIDADIARKLANSQQTCKTAQADRSQGFLRIQCPHCSAITQDFDLATVQVFVCPNCERASLVAEYRQ